MTGRLETLSLRGVLPQHDEAISYMENKPSNQRLDYLGISDSYMLIPLRKLVVFTKLLIAVHFDPRHKMKSSAGRFCFPDFLVLGEGSFSSASPLKS